MEAFCIFVAELRIPQASSMQNIISFISIYNNESVNGR